MFNLKTAYLPIAVVATLAASALVSIDAQAAQTTRAEVRAETVAAMRDNRIARNDADVERIAVSAWNGPARSRADVKARTRAAMAEHTIARNDAEFEWQIQSHDEDGMPMMRAEVVAQTREAMRLGLIPHGELDVVATPQQLQAVALAGQRAAEQALGRASR